MITISKRSRADDAFAQRKFFKKTAKGKVLKGPSASSSLLLSSFAPSSCLAIGPRLAFVTVIRERYLRNDIPCGSAFCEECLDESQKPVLPRQGFTSSTLVPQGHYVVPDTNAFLHQVSPHSLFTPRVPLLSVS